MRNIKIFLSEFYQYIKRDFWLVILANIVLGFIVSYFEVHFLVMLGSILIMVIKTFSFVRTSSIMPSVSSDFARYSWKYLQALPLSKREILVSLALTNLLVLLPAVVWFLSFLPIIKIIFESDSPLQFTTFLRIFLYSIPGILIISFKSINNSIIYPRTQYSRVNQKLKFLENVKRLFVLTTFSIYSVFLYFFIQELTDIKFGPYVQMAVEAIGHFLTSWWVLPTLFVVAYGLYKRNLISWQDEKIGYIKLDWRTKRDVPVMTLCLMLLSYPATQVDWSTPRMYKDSELLKAVYDKDLKEVDHLLAAGNDINATNKHGFNALMVAAHIGDLKIYRHLESKGAKPAKTVFIEDDDYNSGMDIFLLAVDGKNGELVSYLIEQGFSPDTKNQISKNNAIHIAAKYCKIQALESLIKHKADLNAKTGKGNTALHIAAKDRCFGAVAMLIDAGADASVLNNDKKLAVDYMKQNDSETTYYLQKRLRAPAGK